MRREIRFEGDNCVEEAGLLGEADGRGGVERGTCDDVAQRCKACGGGSKCDVGRAGFAGKVGSHADVGCAHPLQGIVERHAGVKVLLERIAEGSFHALVKRFLVASSSENIQDGSLQ